VKALSLIHPSIHPPVRPSARPSIQSIYPSINLWLYSTIIGPWPLFQFLILYTVGWIPWTGDQPVARTLRTQAQNKRTHRHPCLELDSSVRASKNSSCPRSCTHCDRHLKSHVQKIDYTDSSRQNEHQWQSACSGTNMKGSSYQRREGYQLGLGLRNLSKLVTDAAYYQCLRYVIWVKKYVKLSL
jgi:hypothetical protein